MGFITTLTGTLHITDTTIIDHIDTIIIAIIDVLTEVLTTTEVTELQQPLEEDTLLVVEELQLQDVLLMFTEEVIVELIVITEILAQQEIQEDTTQEEVTTLTIEVLNDQLEREVITQIVADLLVAIEVHLVQQEALEGILQETIELPIMVFVNLHQLETLEAILRETKIIIGLLENHTLQETLKTTQSQLEKTMLHVIVAIQENLEATQNLQEAHVVTLLLQEVVLHLEVAQE